MKTSPPDDKGIPSLKSNSGMRAVMRRRALAVSSHPDTNIAQLADFIDILVDDVETLMAKNEELRG